jgi:hypothetical protein
MDLLDAAAICLAHEKILPAVCLAFVAVDTMAALSRPTEAPRVTRTHFIDWVERYLLPGSGLPCSALEIYAARCGLLHSQSPRSELGERGEARELWYGWGSVTAAEIQAVADRSQRAGRVVGVKLEQLLQAVVEATARFGLALARDPELEELVAARTRTMFSGFTRDEGGSGTNEPRG